MKKKKSWPFWSGKGVEGAGFQKDNLEGQGGKG